MDGFLNTILIFLLKLTSDVFDAVLLAVVKVVNNESVFLNPSISYTLNKAGSVCSRNYTEEDAETDTLPRLFVNVNVTDAAANTISLICVCNSVKLYTPSVKAVTYPVPPVTYFNYYPTILLKLLLQEKLIT